MSQDEVKKIIDRAEGFVPSSMPPKLVACTLGDFLQTEFPPRENILAPWLQTRSLNMIYSWRGVGKTHCALGIAYAVASGGEFLGWKAEKPRGVLYIDGEMSASALKDRLMSINAGYVHNNIGENFRLVTPDQQTDAMPDLATPDGQARIDEIILPSTELIIIDNLSCLARSGGRENDAESWNNISQWALAKRTQGISVLFIHHAGKNGNQRGTSKREDILDVVITLKHPENYNPEDGTHFEVHFEKSRHIHGKDVNSFSAKLIQEEGKQNWSVTPIIESNKSRIIALHKEGLKPKEIASRLEIDPSTVHRNLDAAEKEGTIKPRPKRNKS
jgi:hypothetical protein